MARRRGFFAEMQHQAKVAEREAELRRNRAARERQAAQRQAEQAYKAEQRAVAAFRQATAAQQKQLEREAKAAHVEAMQSEAARLNADLAAMYEEIDSLLAATLDVDDFVDLEQLRQVAVVHPPFDLPELETPVTAAASRYRTQTSRSTSNRRRRPACSARRRSTPSWSPPPRHSIRQPTRRGKTEMTSLPGRREAALEAHAKQEALRGRTARSRTGPGLQPPSAQPVRRRSLSRTPCSTR